MSSKLARSPTSISARSASAAPVAAARSRHDLPEWALDALLESGLAAFAVLEGRKIAYLSPGLMALVGRDSSKAAPPSCLSELVSDAECARVLAGFASVGARHRDICGLRHASGADAYVALDATTIRTAEGLRTLLIATKVTGWSVSQARLRRLAFTDELTGLANRALLHDRIQQAIAATRRNSGSFALLLIDLDRFKPINDVHGHATGDLALCETARRLRAATRGVDTVARLGGDEFVVLLGGSGGRGEVPLVTERIIKAVTEPLAVHGLRLGVSVGIALYPDNGADTDQLLAQADVAMYEAKDRGGNCYACVDGTSVRARTATRLSWSTRYAIGVQPIDQQHETLVTAMNSLWEALVAGQDRATLERGMTEMTRLLEFHFATENAHMTAHPYPGAAEHRADHERALETARKLAAHVDEQSLALGIRLMYDWLLSHARSYDAEFPRHAGG